MGSDDIQKIASAILRSVSGVGVAQAGTMGCGATTGTLSPYSCAPNFIGDTFDCQAPMIFRCGGTSGGFTCVGNLPDDFSCYVDFSCPPPGGFVCQYSFDNSGLGDDCVAIFDEGGCGFSCGGAGGADYTP